MAMLRLSVLASWVARWRASGQGRAQRHVYNRTADRADAWVAANGGKAQPTPREAALDAEIVFACVGTTTI